MAFNCIFNSALLLPTFAILTAATGFLDQGCTTSELPWYLDDGVAKAYCATHICDSNVQTTLNLNLCVGNVEGQLVAAKDGNFGNTCKYCSIVGDNYDSLQCICLDDKTDNWVESTLNLSKSTPSSLIHYLLPAASFATKTLHTGFIYNWFGYLSCFNQHQTDIPIQYFCVSPTWQPDPKAADGNVCNNPSCRGPQGDAGHVPIGADATGVP